MRQAGVGPARAARLDRRRFRIQTNDARALVRLNAGGGHWTKKDFKPTNAERGAGEYTYHIYPPQPPRRALCRLRAASYVANLLAALCRLRAASLVANLLAALDNSPDNRVRLGPSEVRRHLLLLLAAHFLGCMNRLNTPHTRVARALSGNMRREGSHAPCRRRRPFCFDARTCTRTLTLTCAQTHAHAHSLTHARAHTLTHTRTCAHTLARSLAHASTT